MSDHERRLRAVIELAQGNVTEASGQPYGAMLVRDGQVIATGANRMHRVGAPTAHAEMEAIRAASEVEDVRAGFGYNMYASGQVLARLSIPSAPAGPAASRSAPPPAAH